MPGSFCKRVALFVILFDGDAQAAAGELFLIEFCEFLMCGEK